MFPTTPTTTNVPPVAGTFGSGSDSRKKYVRVVGTYDWWMMTLPDKIISRLARRYIASELVGTPVDPSNAQYIPTLRTQDRGTETVVYVIETGESITHHNPDTARELVETLADFRRKERTKASSRGVRGLSNLQQRVELETGVDYEESLKEAKETVIEYPDELLSMIW